MRTKGKFVKLSTQKCSRDRRRNLGKNATTCSCNLFDVCSWKVHHRTHTTTTTMAFKKATKKDIRRDGNAIVDEFTRYKRSCFKNYFFTQTHWHRIDLFVAHTGKGGNVLPSSRTKASKWTFVFWWRWNLQKLTAKVRNFTKPRYFSWECATIIRTKRQHQHPPNVFWNVQFYGGKELKLLPSFLSGWCPETRKTTLRVSPPSLRNRFGNLIKMKSWNAARVHFTTILGGVFPYEILIAACNYWQHRITPWCVCLWVIVDGFGWKRK